MPCIICSMDDEAVASLPDTQRLIIKHRVVPVTSQKVIEELRGLDRGEAYILKYSLIPVRIYRKTLPVRGNNRAFWTRHSSFS